MVSVSSVARLLTPIILVGMRHLLTWIVSRPHGACGSTRPPFLPVRGDLAGDEWPDRLAELGGLPVVCPRVLVACVPVAPRCRVARSQALHIALQELLDQCLVGNTMLTRKAADRCQTLCGETD
jgi:hypothetical protein